MIAVSAPELCQKGDFYLKKRTKGIFVHVLECLLSLDKMQNISTLLYKKFEISERRILKVIKFFITNVQVCIFLYIECSGPVIGFSIETQWSYLDPLRLLQCPWLLNNLRTATRWCPAPQTINRNVQNFLFLHIFLFFIRCQINDLHSACISMWTDFIHINVRNQLLLS